jgi:stage V sporulation protein SpoVS
MTVTDYRVSATTSIGSLAGAVAHALRRGDGVDLVVCGLRQIGVAAQGAATAREYLLDDGLGMTVEIQRELIVFQPLEMRYGVRIALRATALHGEAS